MRISFRAVGVLEAAHEAQLLAERSERFRRLTELEIGPIASGREPAPFVDAVLGFGQRHAIGSVEGTETARKLAGDLGSHRFENREGKGDTSKTSEECSAVQLIRACHHEFPSRRFRISVSCYFCKKLGLLAIYRTMSFNR